MSLQRFAAAPDRGVGGTPAVRARLRASVVRRHRELSLFLLAYLGYVGARWVFATDLITARANAEWIIDLERWGGAQVEASVQQAFSSELWTAVLSNVYLAAQLLVLPVSLVALHRFARPVYRTLRNTVIATWAISIPIFALFPVAPPRLAGIGLVDTVSGLGAASLTGSSTIFYNPYAAVPSLHVGFAFAIGIAVALAVRHPALKALALMWGPIVTLTVVATGNHYLFDIAAGLVVTVAGWWVGEHVAARASQLALPSLRPRRR